MDIHNFDGDIGEFEMTFEDFFTVPVMSYCVECDEDLMSSVWTNSLTDESFHECPKCGMPVTPITEMEA